MGYALLLPIICLSCIIHGSAALTDAEKQVFADNGVTIADSSRSGFHLINTDNDPNHATGTFPSAHNPNEITEQNINFEFPKSPSIAEKVSCVPQGPVMMAVNGVVMYSTYNALKEDANVVEVFDDCKGHPDNRGVYHYHQNPACVYQGGNDELLGVALDGFPIYGPKDASGTTLTSADLDICHGIMVNGQYRYHVTADFPYTLGCLKGEVTIANARSCYCALASDYVGKSDSETCEESDDMGGGDGMMPPCGGDMNRPVEGPGGDGMRPPPPDCAQTTQGSMNVDGTEGGGTDGDGTSVGSTTFISTIVLSLVFVLHFYIKE